MSLDALIGLMLCVLTLVYLVVAMLKPEKF